MAELDLTPNPFVAALTAELGGSADEMLSRLPKEAPADEIAAAIAAASDRERISFVGYLGETVEHDGKEWCVLYLDWELATWLLVEKDGIVRRKAIKDVSAPDEKRDVIWVKPDAAVGLVTGSQSVQAQFLTGEFTRAGDFEAPVSGGTFAASTGVFCQAKSAGCCGRPTRR